MQLVHSITNHFSVRLNAQLSEVICILSGIVLALLARFCIGMQFSGQFKSGWHGRLRRIPCTAIFAIALWALAMPLHAQMTSGSITGTVLDPAGSVVPGAMVTATNEATGAQRTASSNEAGVFNIPALPPGTYSLALQANGFTAVKTNVTLSLNQVLRYDFRLKVGNTTQTVVVQASGALNLETESHDLANVFEQQSLENLPSNNRTVFAALGAGTNIQTYRTLSQDSNFNAIPQEDTDINSFNTIGNALNIGGSVVGTTTYLQDGVQNYNLMTNTANMQPSIEATQEVNVISNGASARFDQASVVNVVTKSGSTSYHGRLYDYLQNNDLNAIGELNVPQPPLRYNQFGANIGGPVPLTKKIFFFFDYQGQRYNQGTTLLAFFPTAAERSGDFSADSFTIYDPLTYNPTTGTISSFPQNTIPGPRINDFSSMFLKYIPLPTGSTVAGDNYQATSNITQNFDDFFYRADYNIGQNDSIYGAYETNNPKKISPAIEQVVTNIFNSENDQLGKNAYIQETHTFTPHLVNVARIGYNRSYIANRFSGDGSQNYFTALGLTGLNPQQPFWQPPGVSFTSHSTVGGGSTPQSALQNLFQYADELNWTKGKHSTFFGAELDRFQFTGAWANSNNGIFSFNGQYTSNHQISGKYPVGGDIADFLLGYPYSVSATQGSQYGRFRQYNFMPYFQDDWRASRKLTLNLGIRYDYHESPIDVSGHSGIYDIATYTFHPGTFHQNYLNFAPRFGFAYSVNDKTAVHGGYGIYYSAYMYNNLQFMTNDPFYVSSLGSLGGPFPVTQLVSIQNAFTNMPAPNGVWTNTSTVPLIMKTPYVQQWNVAAQRSIASNWMLSLGYVGSTFIHQAMRRNVNQATPPTDPSNPGTINSRRPYPGFPNDLLEFASVGRANYHGFQADLERHYSNGFSLIANAVWSKSMDFTSSDKLTPEFGPDPGLDYGRSDFDQPYVYKVSGIYELPFGPGKPMLNSRKWLDDELSGWQVSGILSVNAGLPFDVTANDLSLTGGSHAQRANQACDGSHPANQSFKEWFNTSCYVQPSTGELGNMKRNILQGPRDTNLDASLFKSFPFYKEDAIQFRTDLFSALNHPLPGDPNISVTNAAYGQITFFAGARVVQFSLKVIY